MVIAGSKVFILVISYLTDMRIIAKAKKWGSSLGVVIPKSVSNSLEIEEEQEVIMDIMPSGKSDVLKEAFGKCKNKGERKTAQEWKNEFRRTLYRE